MKKLSSVILVLFCMTVPAAAQTSLPPKSFNEHLKKEKGILIHVRTPEEYQSERIDGAMNINVNDSLFTAEISRLDKAKTYFLYCGVGKRSAKAVDIFKKNGFDSVFDLEKGLTQWKAEGFPTIKGPQKNRI